VDLGVAADTQHVGGVELHFRAGAGPRRNLVGGQERSVNDTRHPIAGIAAADRNFTTHNGDASYPALEVVRILCADGRENSQGQQRGTRHS
jgi:hypothetical protein